MKSFFLCVALCVVLTTVATGHESHDILNTLRTVDGPFMSYFDSEKNHFGLEKSHQINPEDGSFSTHVRRPDEDDDEYNRESYESAMNFFQKKPQEVDRLGVITCAPGTGTDFMRIFPEFKGSVTFDQEQTFSSPCFKSNTATLVKKDDSTIVLTIKSHGKNSLLCYDWYLLANINTFHVESIFLPTTHTVTISNLNEDAMSDITDAGLRVFRFCDNHLATIVDLLKTVELFFGGFSSNPKLPPPFGSHAPKWQKNANLKFMEESMGIVMESRDSTYVDVEDQIQSGDLFAPLMFNGLGQLIMVGTGGHISHNAMAMRIDGKLYVLEAQGAPYWPKAGIQRTEFKQWIQQTLNGDMQVTWLPLRDEIRAKFDADKAMKWFETVEGMPYGFHNFLFGWMDRPGNENLPDIINIEALTQLIHVIDVIVPSFAQRIAGEALNIRLGTKGLSIVEASVEAEKQGFRLDEVYAMVEKDGWMYSDGYSMVCSAFATSMWKQGGIFDGLDINGVEFTPKDNYMLNLFKTERPQACVDADPDSNICQLTGDHRIVLPGFNTLELYSHMNETCPSKNPNYARPDGC